MTNRLHVCDMQTEQELISEGGHEDALFCSWPEENKYGIFRPVKGWLCAVCRKELNARLLDQPDRKQVHTRRRREVETEI